MGVLGESAVPRWGLTVPACAPYTVIPLNTHDLLRTKYGPAGHMGKQQKGRPVPPHG